MKWASKDGEDLNKASSGRWRGAADTQLQLKINILWQKRDGFEMVGDGTRLMGQVPIQGLKAEP